MIPNVDLNIFRIFAHRWPRGSKVLLACTPCHLFDLVQFFNFEREAYRIIHNLAINRGGKLKKTCHAELTFSVAVHSFKKFLLPAAINI